MGLGLGLLAVPAIGLVVFVDAQSKVASGDGGRTLFDDATVIRPAMSVRVDPRWLAATRRLVIEAESAEVWTQRDGVVHRYVVHPRGSARREPGAEPVDTGAFDLRELDLALVPRLVDEAGGAVERVEVRRDGAGRLRWSVSPTDEEPVWFGEDGSRVSPPTPAQNPM